MSARSFPSITSKYERKMSVLVVYTTTKFALFRRVKNCCVEVFQSFTRRKNMRNYFSKIFMFILAGFFVLLEIKEKIVKSRVHRQNQKLWQIKLPKLILVALSIKPNANLFSESNLNLQIVSVLEISCLRMKFCVEFKFQVFNF